VADDAFASFERKWLDANPEQAAVLVFLSPDERPRASAFGTLIHELAQSAFVIREPQVAAAKLSWWEQELSSAAAGNPRHPISNALFADSRTRAIDPALWRALIDGAIAQLDASFPADFGELRASLAPFYLPVAAIETRLGGVEGSSADAIATLWICSHLLTAAQQTSTLLPLDLLARHGASREEIGTPGAKRSAVLKDLIGTIGETLETHRRIATQATLGRRVRSRVDAWLADRAVYADDPARYLSRHARSLRWRSVWWAWREARRLRSAAPIPN
jgi:phytoene synthase